MGTIKRILITGAIFLALIVIIFFQFRYSKKQKEEISRWRENYVNTNTELIRTTDELGRKQNQVETLNLTTKELSSQLFQKDSAIRFISKELSLSNVKIKDLEWSLGAALESNNDGSTIIQTVYDTVYMDSVKKFMVQDSSLTFSATIRTDTVDWDYSYYERFLVWAEMAPTLYKDNGKKRWKLWVWIAPKKKPVIFTKSTNSNSEIEATQIQVR